MAVERVTPYNAFNFLVDLGTGDTESVRAGFQEVSGLNVEITMSDYRNGNEKSNRVRKIPGMYSVGDVTLKRGLIGAMDLWEWVTQLRNGAQDAGRNVTIQLQNETRDEVVMTWRLVNAKPMTYTAPTLNAQGGEVAVEELVLSCEDIFIE